MWPSTGSWCRGQSHADHDRFLLIDVRDDLSTIEEQKGRHRGVTDPFVAVDEGVVADQGKGASRSLLHKRRVQILTVERHPWLGHG